MDNYNILKDLSALGKQYSQTSIDKKDMLANPIFQFISWIDHVIDSGIKEPNAMILSTVSTDLKPSSRTVFLKYITDNGFIFFSNYQSKKGKQLESNPNASAVIFWPEVERQVRIEGKVQKTSSSFSDNYFKTRPTESQLGAIISPQSEPIPSIEHLLEKRDDLEQSFKNKKFIRPYYWGGYILIPELMEFWQGRPYRLSDRFQYKLIDENWIIERLSP